MVCKWKRRKPTPGEMSCLTTLCLVVLDCLESKAEGLYQLKSLTPSVDCINLKESSAICLFFFFFFLNFILFLNFTKLY